ncbi:hypothetical protein Tco_0011586 [Tanacetum coccineum]
MKKCLSDESLVIPLEELRIDDKLHFVEEPIEVMDREIKQLKRSRIPIIKVRWNSKRGPEFTWEREDQFKQKYPHLFTKTTPSSKVSLNKKSFREVSSTSGRQSVVDRLEAVWVSSSFEAELGFLLVLKLGFSAGSNLVDVALQDPCESYIVLLLFTYLRILVSSFVVLERLMLFMLNMKSRLNSPTAFLIFE